MKTKRNNHRELSHAMQHLENCKTQYLFAESIINKLLEGELKKQRKEDKVSEEMNKDINKNMGGNDGKDD